MITFILFYLVFINVAQTSRYRRDDVVSLGPLVSRLNMKVYQDTAALINLINRALGTRDQAVREEVVSEDPPNEYNTHDILEVMQLLQKNYDARIQQNNLKRITPSVRVHYIVNPEVLEKYRRGLEKQHRADYSTNNRRLAFGILSPMTITRKIKTKINNNRFNLEEADNDGFRPKLNIDKHIIGKPIIKDKFDSIFDHGDGNRDKIRNKKIGLETYVYPTKIEEKNKNNKIIRTYSNENKDVEKNNFKSETNIKIGVVNNDRGKSQFIGQSNERVSNNNDLGKSKTIFANNNNNNKELVKDVDRKERDKKDRERKDKDSMETNNFKRESNLGHIEPKNLNNKQTFDKKSNELDVDKLFKKTEGKPRINSDENKYDKFDKTNKNNNGPLSKSKKKKFDDDFSMERVKNKGDRDRQRDKYETIKKQDDWAPRQKPSRTKSDSNEWERPRIKSVVHASFRTSIPYIGKKRIYDE